MGLKEENLKVWEQWFLSHKLLFDLQVVLKDSILNVMNCKRKCMHYCITPWLSLKPCWVAIYIKYKLLAYVGDL